MSLEPFPWQYRHYIKLSWKINTKELNNIHLFSNIHPHKHQLSTCYCSINSDKPSRLNSKHNKLIKRAMYALADTLADDEIRGMKNMFEDLDKDKR